MMRTVLFVTVLSLICLNAVQANRISHKAHTSPFTQRSKHTLQRLTTPKLSPVSSTFTEDFTIRVTFANCMKDADLKVEDFSFDENYEVSSLGLKTIVSGMQFELTGKAKNLKTVTVPTNGLPFTVGINKEAVRFNNILTSEGVSNAQAQVTFTYLQAKDFKSITSALSRDPDSKYIGFIVNFGSRCAPSAMQSYSRTLYDRYFKVSSTSGKAKIFSVQTIGTSGSTCRSDIGDSDSYDQKCPPQEQEAEFQVFVTTPAPEDVVTLRTKKGLCRTFAGGVSTASTESVVINTGLDECGPWSGFSACDGCFDVDKFDVSSKSEQCRTRQALPNRKCKVTTECRPCKNKPCDMKASRPRSGETRTECFGCKNNKAYIGWTAPSGCKCGDGCEATGDCCQSWFYYGCQNNKFKPAEYAKGWTPRQCSSSTCKRGEPVIDREYPSYFCYCGANCASFNVDLCCDGKANRDSQCAAVAPGAAPGAAPAGR